MNCIRTLDVVLIMNIDVLILCQVLSTPNGIASLCFPYDDEEYIMYVGANDLGLFLYANILISQNFRCADTCLCIIRVVEYYIKLEITTLSFRHEEHVSTEVNTT